MPKPKNTHDEHYLQIRIVSIFRLGKCLTKKHPSKYALEINSYLPFVDFSVVSSTKYKPELFS